MRVGIAADWGGPARVVFAPQWGSDEPATGSGHKCAAGPKPTMG